jgi:hypothetical protein
LSLPIFLSPAIFSCHRYFVAVNILSPSIFCRHRYCFIQALGCEECMVTVHVPTGS